jgi:tetratricopeptide (TPR) repeat protein
VHAFEAALPLLDASPQLQGVTLHDIGDVRRSEGRLPDAAQLYRQAAEHKRRGARTRSLATTLLALGRALASSDDKPGALAAYEERLAILEGLAERDEQALGVTLHDIGDVRRSEGRLPDAARLYRQAAEHKRLAGDNGKASDLATTLLALGETQFEMGEPSAVAEELH